MKRDETFENKWQNFVSRPTYTDVKDWGLPAQTPDEPAAVSTDITDPAHFSIQEDKLKSELALAKALAAKKKDGVRVQVEEIRKDLEQLQERFVSIPITVDPAYIEIVKEEQDDKIREVHSELRWGIEHHELAIKKLRDRFLEPLDYERITVRLIESSFGRLG